MGPGRAALGSVATFCSVWSLLRSRSTLKRAGDGATAGSGVISQPTSPLKLSTRRSPLCSLSR